MTTSIKEHEGKKYLRRIYAAAPSEGVDQPEHDSIEIDFYAIAEACEIKCPAIAHAAKKILFPGKRGKGSIIADLQGAVAALHRAIELQELRERIAYPLKEVVEKVTIGVKTDLVYGGEHRWEVVPAWDDPAPEEKAKGQHQTKLIGFRVRWSGGDTEGKYFWVGHYLTDDQQGSPSTTWCKHAAERHAERMNQENKLPTDFRAYRDAQDLIQTAHRM